MQASSAALNGRTSTKDRICRYRCRMSLCAIHTTKTLVVSAKATQRHLTLVDVRITACFTSESARMPTCNRLVMPLTLKQFFPTLHLRIFPIQNLEPRTLLSLRDVRSRFLLRNDAFQIQFADSLKQGSPAAINVLGIFQRRSHRRPCQ